MKKLIPMIVTILLLSGFAYGLGLPQPIGGHVTPVACSEGLTIEAGNTRTGEVLTTTIASDGSYMFEFANSEMGLSEGTVIKVTIGGVTEEVIFYGGPILNVNFDIPDLCTGCDSCCPACEVCEVCDSCEVCEVCETCPTVEEQLPYFCPELDELCYDEFMEKCKLISGDFCDPCDNEGYGLIALLGTGFIAILVGLFGKDLMQTREKKQLESYLKTWKDLEPGEKINLILKRSKKGDLQVDGRSHGHLGHERLHSIWIEHTKFKHPVGVMNPNYDESGKYKK